MADLLKEDITKVLGFIGPKVRKILTQHDCIMAGGVVRDVIAGQTPSDVDIFLSTSEKMYKGKDIVQNTKRIHTRVKRNDNDLVELDIIPQFYDGDHEFVLATFDFTICMAGVYYDKKTLSFKGVCHKEFYEDLDLKLMVYKRTAFGLSKKDKLRKVAILFSSLRRIEKFKGKGYSEHSSVLPSIIADISNVGRVGPGVIDVLHRVDEEADY